MRWSKLLIPTLKEDPAKGQVIRKVKESELVDAFMEEVHKYIAELEEAKAGETY